MYGNNIISGAVFLPATPIRPALSPDLEAASLDEWAVLQRRPISW